jgi:hypothetical protein
VDGKAEQEAPATVEPPINARAERDLALQLFGSIPLGDKAREIARYAILLYPRVQPLYKRGVLVNSRLDVMLHTVEGQLAGKQPALAITQGLKAAREALEQAAMATRYRPPSQN